ncbi:hypothetical protein RJ55_06795 [Drechmeria coniospora]|nr:hypothetical protein RJ55_06795 [Drechmeria coniospora]
MDHAEYDPALYDEISLDFRTPRFETRSASPANQSQQHGFQPLVLPLLQSSDWHEDLAYDESPPTCVHYSIEWKLLLNKGGRLTKLMYNPELEQDLVLAPGAFWDKSLKQVVEDRLKQKTPATKHYEAEETNVVVSVSDRAERKLSKHYPEFNIEWGTVEKQLRNWSPLFRGGRKLQIEITFICKATSQPAAMKTRSSTRRGATGRQHAELEAEQDEDEAAGRTNHWTKVYAIMRCDGPPCAGTHCWRDPERKNVHFGLDGEVMQELVTYSEEGNKFEDQKDVPQFIRDLIYKKDHLRVQRKEDSKKRKRTDSLSGNYPIQITNVLPGPSNQASTEPYSGLRPENSDMALAMRQDEWSIPEPRDDAIKRYCLWHCARVRSDAWKTSLQKAATITFQQGLDLKHLYEDQSVDIFVRDDKVGILPGIAKSWVQDVKRWVDELKQSIVQ